MPLLKGLQLRWFAVDRKCNTLLSCAKLSESKGIIIFFACVGLRQTDDHAVCWLLSFGASAGVQIVSKWPWEHMQPLLSALVETRAAEIYTGVAVPMPRRIGPYHMLSGTALI